MSTGNFYQNIPTMHDLRFLTDSRHYYPVPGDWFIALTDVEGSTTALEKGLFKEINAIAAASIMGILNIDREMDLPFVFGGDGATMLIPPELYQPTAETLLATQNLARDGFDLRLRVGIVPVADVLAAGYTIKVARLHVSENYQQAIFTGGGLSYAEKLLKAPELGAQYRISPEDYAPNADFEGLECRWTKIDSAYDEVLSLIIQARMGDQTAIFDEILDKITQIYGDRNKRHPIRINKLRMKTLPGAFKLEARIRFNDLSFRRLRRMAINTLKARFAMRFNIQGWGRYKSLLLDSTDHEKFDDALRMTMSGTVKQREMLQIYLDTLYQQGKIVYGIHTSSGALMTCLVFNHFGRQVHFVDGADGGYAFAAKAMKAQLAQLNTPDDFSTPDYA